MINLEKRKEISEINPDAIVFDNPSFDNSIIGLSTEGNVIYDLELMIDELSKEDNISKEEALEFIDYNTLRVISYTGENHPIVLDRTINIFD